MVKAFPKKWCVESDFTAPNLPLSEVGRLIVFTTFHLISKTLRLFYWIFELFRQWYFFLNVISSSYYQGLSYVSRKKLIVFLIFVNFFYSSSTNSSTTGICFYFVVCRRDVSYQVSVVQTCFSKYTGKLYYLYSFC